MTAITCIRRTTLIVMPSVSTRARVCVERGGWVRKQPKIAAGAVANVDDSIHRCRSREAYADMPAKRQPAL